MLPRRPRGCVGDQRHRAERVLLDWLGPACWTVRAHAQLLGHASRAAPRGPRVDHDAHAPLGPSGGCGGDCEGRRHCQVPGAVDR
eukprot:4454401-Alexandrium_andersonii.AAC.1